jgi:hypothetical protein
MKSLAEYSGTKTRFGGYTQPFGVRAKPSMLILSCYVFTYGKRIVKKPIVHKPHCTF